MRSFVLAVALTLAALTTSSALAQRTPPANESSKSELWGTQDKGDDKGRVQATGRSYNVTHIAYAAVMISITAIFLIWLIRRHSGEKQSAVATNTDD